KISQRRLEMTLFHESCASSLLCPCILWLQFKATIKVSDRFCEILFRDENIAAVEVRCDGFRVDQNGLVQIDQRIFEITQIVLESATIVVGFIKTSIQLQRAIVITHRSHTIPFAIQCSSTAEVCFCESRIDPQGTFIIGY